jgi:hypothetical protein
MVSNVLGGMFLLSAVLADDMAVSTGLSYFNLSAATFAANGGALAVFAWWVRNGYLKDFNVNLSTWLGREVLSVARYNRPLFSALMGIPEASLPTFGMADQVPPQPSVNAFDYERIVNFNVADYKGYNLTSLTSSYGGNQVGAIDLPLLSVGGAWGSPEWAEDIAYNQSVLQEYYWGDDYTPAGYQTAVNYGKYTAIRGALGVFVGVSGKSNLKVESVGYQYYHKDDVRTQVKVSWDEYNSTTGRTEHYTGDITLNWYDFHGSNYYGIGSMVVKNVSGLNRAKAALPGQIAAWTKKYANQLTYGVPVGKIGTTGRFSMGRKDGNATFTTQVAIVDHNTKEKIGEYVYGVRSENGVIKIDDFVTYDISASSVRAAYNAGLSGTVSAYATTTSDMPIGVIDWARGTYINGVVAGENLSRTVRDIVDPTTWSKIGNRIDGTTAVTAQGEHYSSYDLSSSYVQQAISDRLLQIPIPVQQASIPPPPPSASDYGVGGPPIPTGSELEKEYNEMQSAFAQFYGFAYVTTAPDSNDPRYQQVTYLDDPSTPGENESLTVFVTDENDNIVIDNDIPHTVQFNQQAYSNDLAQFTNSIRGAAAWQEKYGFNPLTATSSNAAYQRAQSRYNGALANWQSQTHLSPAQWEANYRVAYQKNEVVGDFNSFVPPGFKVSNQGTLIVGVSNNNRMHQVMQDVVNDKNEKIGYLSFGYADGFYTKVLSYDVKDSYGRVVQHREFGARMNDTTVSFWSVIKTNTAWDVHGRVTAFTEVRDERNPSLTEGNGFSTTSRSNIAYNAIGQAVSYTEVFSKNGGDPVTLNVRELRYDGMGREIYRDQRVTWSNTHYGNVPGISDGISGWRNGVADVVTHTQYNNVGQVIGRQSNGTMLPTASTTNYGLLFGSGEAGKMGKGIINPGTPFSTV